MVVATKEPLKSEELADKKEDLPDLQNRDIEKVTNKVQLAVKSKKIPVTQPKPSKLPVVVATTESSKLLKSEEPAGEKEDLPNLQDKDVERVTKKMQIAFRSKKSPVTPTEQSKPQVATTEPLKSVEPAGEKEDLPDLQDEEIERVTKKIQNPFKSKKSPKSIVEVLDYGKMSKSVSTKEGIAKLANAELFGQSKIVEPVSQSVSINAALCKIEILENENSKLQKELEEFRKKLIHANDKFDKCRCQTRRIQLPNHKGDALNMGHF